MNREMYAPDPDNLMVHHRINASRAFRVGAAAVFTGSGLGLATIGNVLEQGKLSGAEMLLGAVSAATLYVGRWSLNEAQESTRAANELERLKIETRLQQQTPQPEG